MTRILLLFSTLVLLPFCGCSEPESPHFVPATAGTSTSAERHVPVKPVREVEPPIKIDMH